MLNDDGILACESEPRRNVAISATAQREKGKEGYEEMSRIVEVLRSPRFNYFGMAGGVLFIALSVATWATDTGTKVHDALASAKDITLWIMMMLAFSAMAAMPTKMPRRS